RGNADRFAVERRSLSAFCRKKIVSCGVISNTENDLAIVFECDRNAKTRITVGVVGCSVERIDDPFPRSVAACNDGLASFLSKNGVFGMMRTYSFDYQCLGCEVGLGDLVNIVTLRPNVVDAAEFFQKQTAGVAGCFCSEVKHKKQSAGRQSAIGSDLRYQ